MSSSNNSTDNETIVEFKLQINQNNDYTLQVNSNNKEINFHI